MRKLFLAYLVTGLAFLGAGYWVFQNAAFLSEGIIENRYRVLVSVEPTSDIADANTSLGKTIRSWPHLVLAFEPLPNAEGPRLNAERVSVGGDSRVVRYLLPGTYNVIAEGLVSQPETLYEYTGLTQITITDASVSLDLTVGLQPVTSAEVLRDAIKEVLLAGDLDDAEAIVSFVRSQLVDGGNLSGDIDTLVDLADAVEAVLFDLSDYNALPKAYFNSRYTLLDATIGKVTDLTGGVTPEKLVWAGVIVDTNVTLRDIGQARNRVIREHLRQVRSLHNAGMPEEALRQWIFLIYNPELDPMYDPVSMELVELISETEPFAELVERAFVREREVKFEQAEQAFYRGDVELALDLFVEIKSEMSWFRRHVDFKLRELIFIDQYLRDLDSFMLANRAYREGDMTTALAYYESITKESFLIDDRVAEIRDRGGEQTEMTTEEIDELRDFREGLID